MLRRTLLGFPRYQRRSTRLFLTLGVARTGFRRNHFSCQRIPARYAVGCLCRTYRTFRTLPQEALHLFLLFQTLKNALSYTPPPPRFRDFFPVPRPLFVQPAGNPILPSAPKTYLCGSHGDVTRCCELFTRLFPGRDPKLARGVHAGHENLLESVVGDAPPQPTVGPAVPFANMGPDSLRQLSPSVDREALRAQRKAGSK